MMKGSLFLALAAGLLASLMLTTPSQAGSTLVTTDVTFSVSPAGATASDFEITYGAGTAPGPVTILAATTVTGIAFPPSTIVGDTIHIDFTPASSGILDFTFLTALAPPITYTKASLTGVAAGDKGTLTVSVSPGGGVPEPTSLALLGIGITGFFAFRRFFKRTSVA